jgi:hypothetical protein
MNYLEILQQKSSEHEENEMCWSKNYLVGFDADGNSCEINGNESYCDDCISDKVNEIQLLLDTNGSEYIHSEFDCSWSDIVFTKIGYSEEGSPESDDFETCEDCGKSIHTGVLHTLDQEFQHYLEDSTSLKLDDLTNCDCFRINDLITSDDAIERHPELVEKLKQKLSEQNTKIQNYGMVSS